MNNLFESSQDALMFALNFSTDQFPETPTAKIVGERIGRGKGLVGLDGAAQSGMLQQAIAQMDPMRANCIKARYAPKYTDCPCCGGKKPLKIWQNSINELSEWALTTFSGLSHKIVRVAIILNYFDRGVSISEAASRCNVPVKTAYNQRAKIHKALSALDDAAQREIESILESKKMLTAQTSAI